MTSPLHIPGYSPSSSVVQTLVDPAISQNTDGACNVELMPQIDGRLDIMDSDGQADSGLSTTRELRALLLSRPRASQLEAEQGSDAEHGEREGSRYYVSAILIITLLAVEAA